MQADELLPGETIVEHTHRLAGSQWFHYACDFEFGLCQARGLADRRCPLVSDDYVRKSSHERD